MFSHLKTASSDQATRLPNLSGGGNWHAATNFSSVRSLTPSIWQTSDLLMSFGATGMSCFPELKACVATEKPLNLEALVRKELVDPSLGACLPCQLVCLSGWCGVRINLHDVVGGIRNVHMPVLRKHEKRHPCAALRYRQLEQ